jgi:hypothetical protein
MKTRHAETPAVARGICALVFVCLLAGCQSAFPPALNPPAQAEPPRLEIGDAWIYRHTDGYTKLPRGTFTHTITALAGNAVTVEVKSQEGHVVATDRYTRDWNWLDHPMTNLQRFRFDPPYPALPFPLASGKSWSHYVRATDAADGAAYDLARVDGKASDWQRVTVPAGAFDAIYIQRQVYSGAPSRTRSQEYITEGDWYAPAVNNIVRGSYRSEYRDKTKGDEELSSWFLNDWTLVELVEYRPARK